MKIVLLRSVDNLGQAGEAVEVKPGYFRNFLEPRGMALRASAQNLRLVEQKRKKLEALVAREKEGAEKIQEALDGKELTFKLRAGERGQLFGSVTTRDVANAIKEEFNIEVERRRLDMENLKTLGDHQVRIRIYPGIAAHVTVKVQRLILEGEDTGEESTAPDPMAPPEDLEVGPQDEFPELQAADSLGTEGEASPGEQPKES